VAFLASRSSTFSLVTDNMRGIWNAPAAQRVNAYVATALDDARARACGLGIGSTSTTALLHERISDMAACSALGASEQEV
jgi:hypothetical protein